MGLWQFQAHSRGRQSAGNAGTGPARTEDKSRPTCSCRTCFLVRVSSVLVWAVVWSPSPPVRQGFQLPIRERSPPGVGPACVRDHLAGDLSLLGLYTLLAWPCSSWLCFSLPGFLRTIWNGLVFHAPQNSLPSLAPAPPQFGQFEAASPVTWWLPGPSRLSRRLVS